MKTAGVRSILSVMVACLASACSSPVSIGHNDHAATAGDSGSPGGGGDEVAPESCPFTRDSDWVDLQWVGLIAGTNPAETDPNSGPCGSYPLDATADPIAFFVTNDPHIKDTWAFTGALAGTPMPGSSCNTRPATGVIVSTAGAAEQLAVLDSPAHLQSGDRFAVGLQSDIWDGVTQAVTHTWYRTAPLTDAPPCTPTLRQANVQGPWSISGGEEITLCTRTTLASAIDSTYIRLTSSAGTVDAVLTAGDATGPDGQEICTDADDASTLLAIGNGAGTIKARLQGEGVHLAAGQQVVLRVHAVDMDATQASGSAQAELF